MRYEETLK